MEQQACLLWCNVMGFRPDYMCLQLQKYSGEVWLNKRTLIPQCIFVVCFLQQLPLQQAMQLGRVNLILWEDQAVCYIENCAILCSSCFGIKGTVILDMKWVRTKAWCDYLAAFFLDFSN